jgi:hypothetical protein
VAFLFVERSGVTQAKEPTATEYSHSPAGHAAHRECSTALEPSSLREVTRPWAIPQRVGVGKRRLWRGGY